MKKLSSSRAKCPMTRRFDSEALHLARAVWQSISSPVSRTLDLLARLGKWEEIVAMRLNPSDYASSDAFRKDYLAVSLMSKFPNFDIGIDLEAKALTSFLDCELMCSATNIRIRQRSSYVNGLYSPYTPESILFLARGKIAKLLGPLDWAEAEAHFRFGPGATTSRPHREGDSYYKYREKPCTTAGCAILAYTALRRIPRWYSHVESLTGKSHDDLEQLSILDRIAELFTVVDGNRITFVPKSATKLRTIAIEPTMNGFIQHGIGRCIRRRLKRVGIDLDNQSHNQELAREGSISGTLSTLDLANASDSVSLSLVEALLPPDWFDAVCRARSAVGTLPSGEKIHYQKVSSMGNGFTFELESLIFWALCSSVCSLFNPREHRLSVYGDDLIVPSEVAPTVMWILDHCGFSLNREKSFWSGPFRESCGKHYFLGDDVTPFYVRSDIDSYTRVIWFCNQIRRWSRLLYGLDPTLHGVYDIACRLLPHGLRNPSIPDGYGDLALIGDFDEVLPRRASDGFDGWRCSVWLPIVKTREFSDVPFLLRQLQVPPQLSVQEWADSNRVARLGGWRRKNVRWSENAFRVPSLLRDPIWRRVSGVVTNWPSFGPWLDAED